jgi:hypothetical protein
MSSNEKFEVLETSIPKTPQTWTGEDVQKWLKILQMERYTDQFRKFKFPDNPNRGNGDRRITNPGPNGGGPI